MTEQITLEQALELVAFDQYDDGAWFVTVVKGFCGTVKGNCGAVKGYCGVVEGDCGIVKGYCSLLEGDCGIVNGHVRGTINGREWQYVEPPRKRMTRLIEEGASKEELLKALEELND